MKFLSKIISFIIIFILGMIVFFFAGYLSSLSYNIRTIVKIIVPLVFLFLTLYCRKKSKYRNWYLLFLGFFAGSSGFLASWFLSSFLMNIFGITTKSVSGLAYAKMFDAIPIIVIALIIGLKGGLKSKDMFLCKGKMSLWIIIGSVFFLIFMVLYVIQALDLGISFNKLITYAPWTLMFVFFNAFMEEFHFRGLLLKSAENILGKNLANICIALFFTLVHMPVKYTPDIYSFLGILFILSLAWGFVIQKTESIWGAVLFHAGADLMIIIGIYQSFGAI